MQDLKKAQALIVLFGLIAFLIVIDSQCYSYSEACLPDLGFVTTAPEVVSDQSILLKSFAHGEINKEWKEKLGAVYTILASKTLTGNYHTFPIISSIALLIVTYFFALKITSNRLASIVSVVILEFSRTFMWYSDDIAYPNFFMVFLLLSIYPFTRSWIKPIAFVTSFVFKAEALAFFPLTFIKEKDKRIRLVYIGIAIMVGAVAIALNWVRFDGSINTTNLLYPQIGLYLLDQDMWILSLLTPVTILLFYLRKHKVEWSGYLLLAMGYCLLFQYILPIFTSYNAYGYRMLPFVVFFALSVALIISKKEMLISRLRSKELNIT